MVFERLLQRKEILEAKVSCIAGNIRENQSLEPRSMLLHLNELVSCFGAVFVVGIANLFCCVLYYGDS